MNKRRRRGPDQIAQRILHRARTTEGPAAMHDAALVKRLLREETDDILARLRSGASGATYAEAETRYRKAEKTAMRWIKNYVELDFRNLASYTRAERDAVASAPDAR